MASSIPTPLSVSTTSSTLSRPIFTGLQRTLDQRVAIALESLKRLQNCLDPLARYEFLISMLYTDANLFFALALAHTSTIMPLVYTPLVGAACISWSHLSMPFRGLYISLEDKGNIANKLRTWPQPSVKAICVTDGERIL